MTRRIPAISYFERIKVLNKIVEMCQEHLLSPKGKQVLSYFQDERCLTAATLTEFKLGSFPNISNIFSAVGYEQCHELGISSGFGSSHPAIIPIMDQYGETIAIMGRSLYPQDELDSLGLSKYYNSFYEKSNNLFGLNLAQGSIVKKGFAYVVEGNFDVIMCHQNGVKNVVGTSNASLSGKQYILLNRYAEKIVMMFDNDEAGQLGAQRAQEKYDQVFVKKLPEKIKDVDEYFRKYPRRG